MEVFVTIVDVGGVDVGDEVDESVVVALRVDVVTGSGERVFVGVVLGFGDDVG